MNPNDYRALLAALDEAIAILDRNRTPDPASIAAFDTLKQARARIVRAMEATAGTAAFPQELELAAA